LYTKKINLFIFNRVKGFLAVFSKILEIHNIDRVDSKRKNKALGTENCIYPDSRRTRRGEKKEEETE
jgi:hypothetical protein